MTPVLLIAIICLSQAVETVTGFGCTVIALALGVHLVPVQTWVVTLVMIAWLQSAWLVCRGFRVIDWALLLERILPCAVAGLPLGFWCFGVLGSGGLKHVLGAFVIVVSSLELARLFRRGRGSEPLPWPLGIVLLCGGGFFHGLFASGGPLVVYYSSREIADKGAFRATLSCLWLLLNSVLLVSYALTGRLVKEPAFRAAYLLPALAVGILVGEILHHRVNELTFKRIVQVLLFLTGVVLLV